jgi:dTMP kinase
MKKNLFIAFEGIDGSGKSTQVKILAERLEREGHRVYATFEPTDSRIGTIIRDIFRHKMEADHRTIAALYVADRLHHLLNKQDGILKKLDEGFTVITDRYYFSSYAYQGLHVPMEWVISANSLSAELLRPDLTVYVDISPETGMKRVQKSRAVIELFESIRELDQVRQGYLKAFELLKDKENICMVDGERESRLVAEDIWNRVAELGMIHLTGGNR